MLRPTVRCLPNVFFYSISVLYLGLQTGLVLMMIEATLFLILLLQVSSMAWFMTWTTGRMRHCRRPYHWELQVTYVLMTWTNSPYHAYGPFAPRERAEIVATSSRLWYDPANLDPESCLGFIFRMVGLFCTKMDRLEWFHVSIRVKRTRSKSCSAKATVDLQPYQPDLDSVIKKRIRFYILRFVKKRNLW